MYTEKSRVRVRSLAEKCGSWRSESGRLVEASQSPLGRPEEIELRHLESSEWKRHASSVPRFFSVPIAARLIDHAESLVEEIRAQNGFGTGERATERL